MLQNIEQNHPAERNSFKTKLTLLLSVILAIGLGIFSCEGPVGPEGPPGPPGPTGAVGPAGSDGNMMLAGEGSPESDLGNPGDFYLDLATGDLYGPKDTQGWGESSNLSGADGADGSQIYAGDGPPEADLGNEGDYFLDKTNFQLYGPKTTEGWGTPIDLQGPEGPEGPSGTDGVSGWQRIAEFRSMDPGSVHNVVVACPAGKVPVGGGFNAPYHDVIVYKSYPTANNQWLVTGRNTNESLNRSLRVYVICIFAN